MILLVIRYLVPTAPPENHAVVVVPVFTEAPTTRPESSTNHELVAMVSVPNQVDQSKV